MYRLFSAENSVFSGKVRAYLRFKHDQGDLGPGYEDILVTPELIEGLLVARSGSPSLPQLETPDGTWLQDSSEIIDHCERVHPRVPIVPGAATRPRQRLAAYLIELLADEWLIVPACWERWFFSEDGREPSHRAHNEHQWGAIFGAGLGGPARRAAGAKFFEEAFGISEARVNPRGPYAGLIQLGCTQATERAWRESLHRLLQALEIHFGRHDYLLGGRPSLADYGLLGPLYAHFYRDPVPGFALRCFFPLVCEWVERTNAEGCLNARRYGQKLYRLGPDGSLVGRPATSVSFQVITPNEMRGQTSALYILVTSIMGLAVGTSVLAAFTDFVYQSDAAIHYSIATICALFYPAAATLFLYCLPAFRAAVEEAETGTWDI